MAPSLIDFLRTQEVSLKPLGILDIGALLLEGSEKEYKPLQEKGLARVIGFEPVPSECDRLNQTLGHLGMKYLPYFIGDGTEQSFYLTNHTMTASLYEPNLELLNLMNQLGELCQVESIEKVQTKRLDDIPEIKDSVEYIKIDIQGAELQAFEGAQRMLDDVVVIHTEVEWVPLYKNQPLFSEIELYLRSKGFMLHRITGQAGRAYKPVVYDNNPYGGLQHLWSDVIFVRNILALEKLSPWQLLSYAIIVVEVYHAIDLALLILRHYDARMQTKLADNYQQFSMPNPQ